MQSLAHILPILTIELTRSSPVSWLPYFAQVGFSYTRFSGRIRTSQLGAMLCQQALQPWEISENGVKYVLFLRWKQSQKKQVSEGVKWFNYESALIIGRKFKLGANPQ